MSAMEGWQKGRLGELCSIEIGGTPSRSNPDFWDAPKDTSNLWVSIRDLNRTVITDTSEHISDSGVKHSNVKLQNSGTVLLSFKLSIGRVAFAGIPLYTNEAIAGLNSNKIDLNYLFHGLHHWNLLQGVDQAIKGATLNKEKLKKITFEYPKSTTEQAKIADILSTVDRAIEQTEALIAKQQRIKTGLMQDLLTRGAPFNLKPMAATRRRRRVPPTSILNTSNSPPRAIHANTTAQVQLIQCTREVVTEDSAALHSTKYRAQLIVSLVDQYFHPAWL